jgi:hypothetical protein
MQQFKKRGSTMKTQPIVAALFALLFAVSAFGQTATPPAAGDGTAGNPYQIADVSNLYWLTQSATNWNKHYIQTADINASATAGWDGGRGLSPIGDPGRPFSGSYDGQGAVISSLIINRATNGFVGLFGYVRGEVGNLGLPGASVTGARFVGPLAGAAALGAEVSSCSASGTVNGAEYIGGLVGSVEDGATLDMCSSLAAVNGGSYVGGLVGRNVSAALLQCFSAGAVTASNSPVGGLVGNNSAGSTSNSFWDTQTSGQAQSGGGAGKTTAEMKDMATYTAAGWDFAGETAGTNDWWNMDTAALVNGGYPVPSWQVVATLPAGSGTIGDPYQIATLNNLYWLSSTPSVWTNNSFFIQTADIPAQSTARINIGQGFSPIGNGSLSFTGAYDGQGHRITGLTINRPVQHGIGLFGGTSGSLIENLGLTDVNITEHGIGGTAVFLGGLAGGVDSSVIRNCYVVGSVQSADPLFGGLVGSLESGSLIEQCWSGGTVACTYTNAMAGNTVGGLVGSIGIVGANRIVNSYSTANVTAPGTWAGGLIGVIHAGANNTSIENCYSAGLVTHGTNFPYAGGLLGQDTGTGTTFSNCFWDTQASGMTNALGAVWPNPAGATGKTTAEMKTQSTFTDAGWDFPGVWRMTEGVTYPLLTDLSACITATAGANGSMAPSGNVYVALGQSAAFAIPPDAFYHVDDVTTNGASVGAVTNFIWSNVTTDGAIHATFAADEGAKGTPHWWLASFGLTNDGASFDEAETNDTDTDTFDANAEYIADTVPTNDESFFQVTDVTHDSPVAVYFDSSTGRLYTLEGAKGLLDGTWTNVPGAGPRMGGGGADSMQDTNEPSAGPFYRMEVELP